MTSLTMLLQRISHHGFTLKGGFLRALWFFVLLSTIVPIPSMACDQSARAEDPFSDRRELWESRLIVASDWLIRKGLFFYDKNGMEALRSKLHDDYIVSPYIPFYVEPKFPYNKFGIVLGGSYFDVACYFRETSENRIYEIWTVTTSYDEDYQRDDRTIYYYASTDSYYGMRTIELISHTPLFSITYADGHVFEIPNDDLVRRKVSGQ